MAAAEQVETGWKDSIVRNWFSWDAWILAAYRDRIDYRSFLESQDKTVFHRRIQEEEKDYIIHHHRDQLLKTIKNNSYEDAKKKTLLHFFGKFCVYLLAISSGFVLSGMFMGHLAPYLPAMGVVLSDVISWSVFLVFYVAHLLVFRVSVPSTAEKILYKDPKKTWSEGWHLFAKQDLIIRQVNGEVQPQFYNKTTRVFEQQSVNNSLKPVEKITGVVLLLFVLLVSLTTAALSVVKVPTSMEAMNLLTFLQLGVTFMPLGYLLGFATFVCTLGLMMSSVIRLLRQDGKLKDFKKLFSYPKGSEVHISLRILQTFFTAIILVGVLALVTYGMYNSSTVEAEDFLTMLHASGQAGAAMGIAVCAMVAKMVFSVRAATNLLHNLGRLIAVKTARAVAWVQSCFSDKPLPEAELIFDPLRSKDHFTGAEKMAAGIGVLCQPAKTAQPPEFEKDDDCDEDEDDDHDDDHDEDDECENEYDSGSPFFSGDPLDICYAWMAGGGALIRQAGAVGDNFEAYDPHKTVPSQKPK